jgi:hypothetical protein
LRRWLNRAGSTSDLVGTVIVGKLGTGS